MSDNDETKVPPADKKLFSFPPDFNPSIRPAVRFNLPSPAVPVKAVRVSLEGKIGSIVDARNYRGNGHWQWDGESLGQKPYTGFIYVIKDLREKKLYLGKKQFVGAGKINKGQDSNWRWYISSSKELSVSIKLHQKENFEFIAIEQYVSKGALSYAETWSLLHVQAPVYRNKWYNVLVNKISWPVKEAPTQRHRERLHRVMEEVGAPLDL